MSNPPYPANWTARTAGSAGPAGRPEMGQQSYPTQASYPSNTYAARSSSRAASQSGSASLLGVMGETVEGSDSPSPPSNFGYSMNMQGAVWSSSQRSQSGASQGNVYPPEAYLPYTDQTAVYQNSHARSVSPQQSPQTGFSTTSYTEGRQGHSGSGHQTIRPTSTAPIRSSSLHPLTSSGYSSTSAPSYEKLQEEIQALRRKVRDLEIVNDSSRRRVSQLEQELANGSAYMMSSSTAAVPGGGGLPTPGVTPSPRSSSFEASWHTRTEARERLLCSINRAGNSLCAWHDPRRERRMYPPRMAPEGYLNCGCTHEQALFEESLARNGVGNYHPGETVRMDPALRNPLLKLLQKRYGYRDGDFEIDPATGKWVEGEGAELWQARAEAGNASLRRNRSDSERR